MPETARSAAFKKTGRRGSGGTKAVKGTKGGYRLQTAEYRPQREHRESRDRQRSSEREGERKEQSRAREEGAQVRGAG